MDVVLPKHSYICVYANSVQFFAAPWTVASQTPLSLVSSRQEYWRGLPFPSPGDLPDPGLVAQTQALIDT